MSTGSEAGDSGDSGRRPAAGLRVRRADVVLPGPAPGLPGMLAVPDGALGLVLFVHGSGSSRHSPRNRYVAQRLERSGLATLLFDLLTAGEDADRGKVFDVELLAARLSRVTAWVRSHSAAICGPAAGRGAGRSPGGPIGYFGASTGAAAALIAAAAPDADVAAVVSRGGRPDLAGAGLPAVQAPTLLVVGSRDPLVLRLNQEAQAQLRCPNHLAVIPGATHLFSEPGTLEAVADLAAAWLTAHLS